MFWWRASTFHEVAKLVGLEKKIAEITYRGLNGELDWHEGLKVRINLLRGTPKEIFIEGLKRLQVNPYTPSVLRKLLRMGHIVGVITGGPTIIIQNLLKNIPLSFTYGNELIFDHGKLIDIDIRVIDKGEILSKVLDDFREFGVEGIVAVGDGANDISMFKIADLSIGVNPKPIVENYVDVKISSMEISQIPDIIHKYFNERAKHRL